MLLAARAGENPSRRRVCLELSGFEKGCKGARCFLDSGWGVVVGESRGDGGEIGQKGTPVNVQRVLASPGRGKPGMRFNRKAT